MLPAIERERIQHLLQHRYNLPHVDWGFATHWVAQLEKDPSKHAALLRAITAAWLDELRDALPQDHRRWRRPALEGLAPLGDNASIRVAKAADRAFDVVSTSLKPLRGEAPVPAIAVVALETNDSYYSFIDPYQPEEGEFATSGGCFIRQQDGVMPFIVVPVQGAKSSIEAVLAHEMTHHALASMGLPLWMEEGFTQMMEDRATGLNSFTLSKELLQRHRGRWSHARIADFWDGSAFHSPEGEDQELAYHLAQLLVRRALTDNPQQFFALARSAHSTPVDLAAPELLGESLDDWAARIIGLDAD